MQHSPLSAIALASITATLHHPMVTLTAVTVRPAVVDPTPLVSTHQGISLAENFRNWDFAVPENNGQYAITIDLSSKC